jgi:hypothetical protein
MTISDRKDARSFEEHFKDVWKDVLLTARRRPVGERAMKCLERIAKDDVAETIAHLEGASSRVWHCWADWYPVWARAMLNDAFETRPWLSLDEDVRKARRLEGQREAQRRDRKKKLTRRIVSNMPDGPILFDELALKVYGSRSNAERHKDKLWDVINSDGSARFGVIHGLNNSPFISLRWRPNAHLEKAEMKHAA